MLSFENFIDTSVKCMGRLKYGFEIRQHEFIVIRIISKNGLLISSEILTDSGTGVNAFKSSFSYFAKSKKTDAAALADMINSAAANNFNTQEVRNQSEDRQVFDPKIFKCWDPTRIPATEYESIASSLTGRMLKSSPLIKETFALLRIVLRKKMFLDSRNTSYYLETGEQSCSLMASAAKGVHRSDAYRDIAVVNNNEEFLAELNLAADDACRQSIQLLDTKSPKLPKQLPVVLDPFSAGCLVHETIGHMSEAWIGEERGYKLPEPGAQLASSCLSVVDDGQYADSKGFTPIDDEGVRSSSSEVLKSGVLSGWLHSRVSAVKHGAAPTGNGRAVNSLFKAIPRMRTTIVAPGKYSVNDLFSDIDLGLYIKGKMCGQARGGSFSMIPYETILIRKGMPQEVIPNALIVGDVFRVLKSIDRVADDLTKCESFGGCEKEEQPFLPVSSWAPHIRISSIGIRKLDDSVLSKLTGGI